MLSLQVESTVVIDGNRQLLSLKSLGPQIWVSSAAGSPTESQISIRNNSPHRIAYFIAERCPTTYSLEDGNPDREVALLEPGKKASIEFDGFGRIGPGKYELVYSHVEDADLDKTAAEYWEHIAEYVGLCYRKRFTVKNQGGVFNGAAVDTISPDGSKVEQLGDRHARILRTNLLKGRTVSLHSGGQPRASLQPPSFQARPSLFYQPLAR